MNGINAAAPGNCPARLPFISQGTLLFLFQDAPHGLGEDLLKELVLYGKDDGYPLQLAGGAVKAADVLLHIRDGDLAALARSGEDELDVPDDAAGLGDPPSGLPHLLGQELLRGLIIRHGDRALQSADDRALMVGDVHQLMVVMVMTGIGAVGIMALLPMIVVMLVLMVVLTAASALMVMVMLMLMLAVMVVLVIVIVVMLVVVVVMVLVLAIALVVVMVQIFFFHGIHSFSTMESSSPTGMASLAQVASTRAVGLRACTIFFTWARVSSSTRSALLTRIRSASWSW